MCREGYGHADAEVGCARLLPREAVEEFVEAVQLILEVGEFGLLGAELGFGIDLAGLQTLLIGGRSFEVGLLVGKPVFHSFALRRILRGFEGFLHLLNAKGLALLFGLNVAERRTEIIQARGGAGDEGGLGLQTIKDNLHALGGDGGGL